MSSGKETKKSYKFFIGVFLAFLSVALVFIIYTLFIYFKEPSKIFEKHNSFDKDVIFSYYTRKGAAAENNDVNKYVDKDAHAVVYDVIETYDGCLVVAGMLNNDGWIMKLNPRNAEKSVQSEVLFNYCYGGEMEDKFSGIVQTEDGFIAAVGETESYSGDLSGVKSNPKSDLWLMIIDTSAKNKEDSIIFNRCYGGDWYDTGRCVIQTSDKCLAVAGSTYSHSGDVLGKNTPGWDIWLLKIDPKKVKHKDIRYGRTFGDAVKIFGDYNANCLIETKDKCLVLCGNRRVDEPAYDRQAFLLKVNPDDHSGMPLFFRLFGGSGNDFFSGVTETDDGYLTVCGNTSSTDGDLKGINNESKQQSIWIAKIDRAGSIVSNKCYDGDICRGLVQMNDGSLTVCTNKKSMVYIMNIDNINGNIISEKYYGVDVFNTSMAFAQTKDGSFAVVASVSHELFGKLYPWVFKVSGSKAKE